MRWIVLFAFNIRVFASLFEGLVPSTPDEIASLNADLLINGFVSVASGQISISQVDLRARGAQDLLFQRTYIAPQILGSYHDDREKDQIMLASVLSQLHAKGWVTLPHLWIGFNNFPYFSVRDSRGVVLEFQIEGNRGVLKTSGYGCSNLSAGEAAAAADIRNTELWVDGSLAKVIWSNGIQSVYQLQFAGKYRLEYEILTNGKSIRYFYNDQGLSRICSADISGKHTYATIERPRDEYFRVSDGREVSYVYESRKIRGKFNQDSKRKSGVPVGSADYPFSVLINAQNPTYSNSASYNDRLLLTFYDAKKYPISCTYWQQKGSLCRVQSFSTPTGGTTFAYDPPIAGQKGGSTTVNRTNGSQIIYCFNSNFLLTAIENWFGGKLHNQKLFFYDGKQHVSRIETKDSLGNVLLAKIYECDAAGNPVFEKWEGDFGVFSIKRVFSKNRIIKEDYSDGLGYEYGYLGGTHLLISKDTFSDGKQIRKAQYFYDEACNLIEETEVGKTITTYLLYKEGPHLHRPEWKIEKDWEENLLHKTHYTYDRFGNLSEEKHHGSDGLFAYRTTKIYDSRDNLIEETNSLGQIASYHYDSRGRRIREVPFSQDIVIQRTFDDKGRLIILKKGDHTSRFAYNASDELIRKIDYLGLETHYRYHPIHGKPVWIEEEPTLLEIVYDDFGREISRKNAYGAATLTQLNSYGDPLIISHPDGGKEFFIYAPNRTLLSNIDPDGVITSYTYDPLKRILSKTLGSRTTTYIYDAYNLLEEKDALGVSTYYQYNLAGNKVGEIRDHRKVQFSYDSLWYLSKKENSSQSVFYQNDVLGRVIAKSINGQLNTSFSYDSAGNITSVAKENTTYFRYDPHGRLIEKIRADGNKTKISYEEGEKQLTKIIQDPKGSQCIETYNAQGLLLKREIPGCILEEYSYDRALRLASHDHLTFNYTPEGFRSSLTEAGRRTTFCTYTPGGKIHTKIKPDGTEIRYQYTAEGNLAQMGSRKFQYDALGQLIEGSGFSREYDHFGNIIREEFATGLTVKTSYDDSDRPIQQILPDQSSIFYEYKGPFLVKICRLSADKDLLYTHTYDQFDLNGHVLSETGAFNCSYHYDLVGRRISQTSPFFSEDLAYDETGNLVRKGDRSYSYDAANQLISSAGQFSLAYDRRYNRVAKNSDQLTVNELNEVEDLTYDINGRLMQENCLFDEFDQLMQVGDEKIMYDSLGRRLQKGEISYVYFGEEEIGSFEKGKSMELKIPGLLAPVALEIDHKPYYPVADVQGTIRMLVDPKISEVYLENDCDPFGIGLSPKIPYAYAGKRYDAQTGLIYFGKRYYIPSLGRWLTPDPLGPVDHSNLYQYVFNNPYRFQDPNGESVGGCLLGLGEIVLGGTIMVGGFALEVVTLGGFTFGLGMTTSTGAALMGLGLATTTYHVRDISFESQSTGGSYTISKNDPGCPQSREVQDKQFKDAVKELEKLLGKKLNPGEVRELHDHVSGQGYGYKELVEEGYWLLGGS